MFLKLLFYFFVLKSAFGYGIGHWYPETGYPRRHDYEYSLRLSGWTKLHEEPAEWLTARVNCHMEGAVLASPWSPDFIQSMYDLVRTNQYLGHLNSDMIWSGVHSSFDEGALKSVDGDQIISLRHYDLAALERCGVFRRFDMDEVECDIALPYICYRPGSPAPPSMPDKPISPPERNYYPTPMLPSTEFLPTEETPYPSDVVSKTLKKLSPSSTEGHLPEPEPNTEAILVKDSSKCGDKSIGYQFAELTGHCYKFHAHAVYTWDLAKAACEKEGAYLAIVNSDDEVKVLKKIFAKKIYGAPFPDTAAIGFSKHRNSWITLEGQSIENAGYAKWRPEAPHFTARLGFIARDGLLYGYTGDVRNVPYICEKPALKQEVNQATKSTKSITAGAEDEAIGRKFIPESVPVAEEIDEAIESKWKTESVPVKKETDKTIESKWNTESVPVAEETDEAIETIWITESVPVAEETDAAIESNWNTESVPVAEETDEAIESIWITESVPVAEETDEAIESIWITESVPVAEETDAAIESKWNTKSVPVTEETDKAIELKWNTESVPIAEETDKAIESKWNTVSDDPDPDDYSWDYPANWDYSYNGYRGRQFGFSI